MTLRRSPLLAALVLAAACSDDTTSPLEPGPTDGSPQPATITFAAKVGAETFACGKEFAGVGTSQKTITPLDFRFYVHDVRLVDAAGKEAPIALTDDAKWQHDGVALLDFEDGSGACENGNAALNAQIKGTVAGGRYQKLRFKLGVPFAQNHADAAVAPSPLNVTSLFWNWQGGYKFARLDATVVGEKAPDGGPLSFVFHLGSTDCVGEPAAGGVTSCGRPNVPAIEITLPDSGVGGDLGGRVVVLDWAALLAGVDVAKDGGGMPGCMSGGDDPECGELFARFGLDGVTGLPATTQTAFRLE